MLMAVSPFVGVWDGKVNDLPAIEVKIEKGADHLTGRIAFYLQKQGKDGKWQIEGYAFDAPMLELKVKGKTLTFETVHYKKHGSKERDPNVKFRMELTGTDEARLIRGEDRMAESLMLVRRK